MSTSDRAYHLAELGIARDPKNPLRVLPPPMPPGARILDVGCGAGQTLIAAYPDRRTTGIDIDLDALRLGSTLTDHVDFVCGAAETLPYRSGCFDLVAARVSLPYCYLPRSLAEIRRVLKPGGQLWMTLHTASMAWEQYSFWNPKSLIHFAYVVANGYLFHWTGRLFALRGRYESIQTERGVRRSLRALGFEKIEVRRRPHFLVTAAASRNPADR